MNIRIIPLLLSALFIVSCGGGGGGSNSSPVQSYSYDKTTADYTNKTWQVDMTARTIRDTPSLWSWDNYASWYPSWSDNGIDIDFVENADYLTINIGYELEKNYSIQLSEIDSNKPLYDLSGNVIAVIAQNNRASGSVDLLDSFIYSPDYMASLNIEYTNVGFLDLFLGGLDRDTFAFNYGSKTFTGDMPKSGSATHGIFGEAILTLYESPSRTASVLLRGEGSLTANFNSNKIYGQLRLNRAFYYYSLLDGGGATSEYQVNLQEYIIDFSEKTYNEDGRTWTLGSISGNSFDNYLYADSEYGNFVGDGVAGGSFFGPGGKELSGTFIILKDEDLDSTGLYDWDMVGAFYGTCKPSGC
jgi:hypothetical protein